MCVCVYLHITNHPSEQDDISSIRECDQKNDWSSMQFGIEPGQAALVIV